MRWEPKKVGRVAKDIKGSERTSLVSFLFALLARLSPKTRPQPSQVTIDSENNNVESYRVLLDDMICDATKFCNNKKKRSVRKFKADLRE